MAVVALILAAAVAGFILARIHAEGDVRREAEHNAEVAAAQIHGRIEQAASLTESLRRFMLDASGTGVTSDQFAGNALNWLPRPASQLLHGSSRFPTHGERSTSSESASRS
ncbi:hypothetical protein [Pseudonocardia alaniniphila]|uniref:Uncharacterized protein n=1 Tax=Pseudonocardia alaniniphila TaxID=75291 RepID=A0ABS9TUD9_9PSEU|nr:hypothetical protein [Pseudonocardia alaniniphila]MCH6172185.1 hypothetical protein [Pseudonocardia alaniniphila]